MTGLDPDLRFDKHKSGIQAHRFVREYGLHLLPHLYEVYNPMPTAADANPHQVSLPASPLNGPAKSGVTQPP